MNLEAEKKPLALENRLRIPPDSAHQTHVRNGVYPLEECERCQSLVRARQPKMPEWSKRPE
jgi:hypothetical protein